MEKLIGRSKVEFISKQELLQTVHISSGQLYRWKRLGLIPEEWFVKQVTHTGQNTVFPRELIETRIMDILKYKEEYSLDYVKKLICPETIGDAFSICDLSGIPEIDVNIIRVSKKLKKEKYTYVEILILIVLTDFRNKVCPQDKAFESMIDSFVEIKIDFKVCLITFLEYKEEYFSIISDGSSSVYIDCRHKKIAEYNLYNLSELVIEKYRFIINKDRKMILEEAINEITKEIGGI